MNREDEPTDAQVKRSLTAFARRAPDRAAEQILRLESELFALRATHQGAVGLLRELAQMPLTASGKDFDRLVKAARELLPEYSG